MDRYTEWHIFFVGQMVILFINYLRIADEEYIQLYLGSTILRFVIFLFLWIFIVNIVITEYYSELSGNYNKEEILKLFVAGMVTAIILVIYIQFNESLSSEGWQKGLKIITGILLPFLYAGTIYLIAKMTYSTKYEHISIIVPLNLLYFLWVRIIITGVIE